MVHKVLLGEHPWLRSGVNYFSNPPHQCMPSHPLAWDNDCESKDKVILSRCFLNHLQINPLYLSLPDVMCFCIQFSTSFTYMFPVRLIIKYLEKQQCKWVIALFPLIQETNTYLDSFTHDLLTLLRIGLKSPGLILVFLEKKWAFFY